MGSNLAVKVRCAPDSRKWRTFGLKPDGGGVHPEAEPEGDNGKAENGKTDYPGQSKVEGGGTHGRAQG
ncbi:MAG: hypothetical protein LBT87_04200 [Treponema sp.]|nr:hypothetical protein [Treponema sp.]